MDDYPGINIPIQYHLLNHMKGYKDFVLYFRKGKGEQQVSGGIDSWKGNPYVGKINFACMGQFF